MAESRWAILRVDRLCYIGRVFANDPQLDNVVEIDSQLPADEQAQAIADALVASGYSGEPVLLGIDASECMSANVPIVQRQQVRQRQAMLYQLEEWLPVSAEEIVADYVPASRGCFAVAVESSRIKPLVDALELRGVALQTISPTGILALQDHVLRCERPPKHAVLWKHGNRPSLFVLEDGKPNKWWVLQDRVSAVVRQLTVLALDSVEPIHLYCYDLDSEWLDGLSNIPDVQVQACDATSLSKSAVAVADGVLSGEQTAWIELRRDALRSQDPYRPVRQLIHHATVAAMAFVVLVTGSLFVRAYRYDNLTANAIARQESIYRDLFPGKRIPAGIHSRLGSEQTQLAAVRAQSGVLPTRVPAMVLLYKVLVAMPTDLRYRLLEIRIEQGRFNLDGEVRAHGDAEKVTEGLRRIGLRVAPTPTHQLPNRGISIRVSGELLGAGSQKDVGKS